MSEAKDIAVVEDSRLKDLVEKSELESTKAAILLQRFGDYFKVAAEWEIKAKAITVTDASQTSDMAMARIGRLELRQKRIAIEHTRKELKEQSLREGKAIDGIANVLKGVIVPIEEYLDKQEKFVERKEAAEKKVQAERKKARELKIEQERIEAERKAAEIECPYCHERFIPKEI